VNEIKAIYLLDVLFTSFCSSAHDVNLFV